MDPRNFISTFVTVYLIYSICALLFGIYVQLVLGLYLTELFFENLWDRSRIIGKIVVILLCLLTLPTDVIIFLVKLLRGLCICTFDKNFTLRDFLP